MSQSTLSLWQNQAFIRLWGAQMLSRAGTEITRVALPFTAILILDATPSQMGLLKIAGFLPNLLFGLFAGVIVDCTRRSPILLGADVGRAVLLGSIPVVALFGHLTLVHLAMVIFASATLTTFFTIASVSILPSLVKRQQLVEANSKLAISDSVLGIAGPGVAGGLIQLVSAPKAIIVDAVSYMLSALSIAGVTKYETWSHKTSKKAVIWVEMREGIRELTRTPLLKSLTLSASIGSLGGGIQQTVLMLFWVHSLGFTPIVIGFVFACGSVGGLLGSAFARRISDLIGVGRSIILGSFLWAIGSIIIPVAGLLAYPLLCVGLGQVFIGIGAAIFSVNQMSLRQHLTPVDRFGRATAARRFLIFGLAGAGAGIGGFFGTIFGLQATLGAGAVGFGTSFLVLFLSPVRYVQNLSATDVEG
ncbi:MAG: MFS transporter [Chloroflexi bacterium]|nr:MFS transporter [Chloroflexota bacterium]